MLFVPYVSLGLYSKNLLKNPLFKNILLTKCKNVYNSFRQLFYDIIGQCPVPSMAYKWK